MKIIKFRVWNGVEMIYDITVGKFGTFYVNPESGNGLNPKDTSCLTSNTTKYHEVPLMQFTRLIDKNEKEIYEGDILNTRTGICYIKYSDEFKRLIAFFPKHTSGNWKELDEIGCGGIITEYIGNIYQNPELL